MSFLLILNIVLYSGATLAIIYNIKNTVLIIMTIVVLVLFTFLLILSILLYVEIDSKIIKGLDKIEKQIKKIKIYMAMLYGVPLLFEIILLIYLVMFFGTSITVYTSIFQLMAITTAMIKVFRPLEDKLAKSRKYKDYLKILNDSIYPNLDKLYEAFKSEDTSTIRNLKHSTEPIYNWMMEKINNEIYAGNKFIVNSNHDNYGEFNIKRINKEEQNVHYVLKSNDKKNAENKGILSEFLDILKEELEKYKQFHDNESNLPFTEIELRKWHLI